jgi:hypothetical protein
VLVPLPELADDEFAELLHPAAATAIEVITAATMSFFALPITKPPHSLRRAGHWQLIAEH